MRAAQGRAKDAFLGCSGVSGGSKHQAGGPTPVTRASLCSRLFSGGIVPCAGPTP